MSRFDTAMDFLDDQDGGALAPNAHCHDCGVPYSRADDDPSTWCDACSDARDAHTSALEIRLAKAGVPDIFSRLPTLSAVANSRAGKPIPKKPIRRKEVA